MGSQNKTGKRSRAEISGGSSKAKEWTVDDETSAALAQFPPLTRQPQAQSDEEDDEEEESRGSSPEGAESGDDEDDQASSEEEEGSSHSSAEDDDDEPSGGDGMADMMAKILGQEVQDKTPVLAKRKTKLMREAEEAKKKGKEERKLAALKHAQLDRQFYTPDHRDIDREKQLRRVATRGVVALFNAITKARAQAEAASQEAEGKTGKKAEGDISKKQFLEMLKKSTKKGTPEKPSSEAAAGSSWAALDDDYMMGSGKMKDWKDGDEEEEMVGDGGDEELLALADADSDEEAREQKAHKRSAKVKRGPKPAKRSKGRK